MLIRWLAGWLAKKATAETRVVVASPDQMQISSEQLRLMLAQAFASGQMSGQQEMWDHLNSIVDGRMHGAQDVVTPEDLARARKGLLH